MHVRYCDRSIFESFDNYVNVREGKFYSKSLSVNIAQYRVSQYSIFSVRFKSIWRIVDTRDVFGGKNKQDGFRLAGGERVVERHLCRSDDRSLVRVLVVRCRCP